MKRIISKTGMMVMVFTRLILFFLLITCFMAGQGMASGKPTAVTKDATYVSSISARLNGTVNPNGLLTTIYWEYGTTTAYGKKTTLWSVGSGTSDSNYWGDVGSLSPKTTYHFRFVAENSAGKAYGADLTFATPASKPDVTTGAATQITANSVRLTGTVNPHGLKTACWFRFGTTKEYESGIGTSPINIGGIGPSTIPVYVDLNKLHVNTVYHYQLVCENSSGITAGADMAFKTKASNLIQVK
jgi:hypothetical protein